MNNDVNAKLEEAFAEITEKSKLQPKASVKKLELTERKFSDDAYNTALDFAEDWLKLTSYVLGISNSIEEVNKKFRDFNIEFAEIDKDSFGRDLSLLFELKTFNHIVDSLNFSKSQKALIMENYINEKMRPKDRKKSIDVEQIQSMLEKLSGKQ